MDEKDIRILDAIATERTSSPDAIHRATDIPKSTVHYRLTKLRERGAISNEMTDVDLDEIGLPITVISEVIAEFEEGYHHEVGEKLGDIEGVNQVYFTMGDTDFIVISNLPTRGMVEGLIEEFERISAIKRTSSKFVITTVKAEANPVADFELDTLLEILSD
ncbi:Lrp/AsnC family transcriptional regulator [Haladaptatus sp. DYF46]|uniref:Lrp/AsnC family transcriptional regulator n=1 Tax=Haladaptatus sp. DYF46 TaxID=2886041 RepID=UPI001E37F97E|nr:Lrp/AsnC family transcriptional regulator [Haladaptatus sp. DYF46]